MNYANRKYILFIYFVLKLCFISNMVSFADVTLVNKRTAEVRDAIVATVAGVDDASDITEEHLAKITSLNLRTKGITSLKAGDFSGMTGLTNLNLYGNQLSSLPDGIFSGLTALTTLRLGRNTVNPLPITVSLEKVGSNQLKAVIPTGAPFDLVLPINPINAIISGDATTLTVAQGSIDSNLLTITRTIGTTDAVSVNIGSLPSLPKKHYGYILSKSDALPIEVINSISETPDDTADTRSEPETTTAQETTTAPDVPENKAPTFNDGSMTIRFITENTTAGTNIGTAIAANDANDDILTYTLRGKDAASFSIDSATGQLKTKAALDYEAKRLYAVKITASDGTLTDTISVIISVIDVADTDLVSVSLPVSERTPQVRDAIVNAVPNVSSAANVTEANLAAITNLNLRSAGITELKSGDFFGLTALASLNLYGNMLSRLPDGIFEGLTSLTSIRLGGNSVDPIPIIVSLQQISSNQYQAVIPTGAPFDIVLPIKSAGSTTMVTISTGNVNSASFTVMNDVNVSIGNLPKSPVNHFGYTLSKSAVCNRTTEVTEAIAAAVPGVVNCSDVSEVQLALITNLDLSNKGIAALSRDDFKGILSLTILDLSNNKLSSLPDGIFEGFTTLTTLKLGGNTVDPFPILVSLERVGTNQIRAMIPTGAPSDIVLPVSVKVGNVVKNTITLSIPQGHVKSQAATVTRPDGTKAAVTVEFGVFPTLPATHTGYALSITGTVPLEIVKALNSAPVFSDGASKTFNILENTPAGENIGEAIGATDENNDTLTFTLSGTDATSFDINSKTGQLITKAALDYETEKSYSVMITVSDGTLTDTINVTLNVIDVDENRTPMFTDGESTTREVAENTEAGKNIGQPVAATDADNDNLTYGLGGTNASAFAIDTDSGQLKTSAALDYESKSSYFVTITVTDGNLTDKINVTINVTDVDEKPAADGTVTTREPDDATTNNAPEFTDGNSTTRSVDENTGTGVDIGEAVSATDADEDILTYTLGGTDSSSFSINSTTGQLHTDAPLDYETKSSYSVTITVADGNGGSDKISVTVNVIDVYEDPANNLPVFKDGDSTTREVAENTGTGIDIGDAVSAIDQDADRLTYSLRGTDASSFGIDSTSGQLRTEVSLDYETKPSYSVTITVSDGNGGSDSISVTINVTDVEENLATKSEENNAPEFIDGNNTTRSITENSAANTNIGTPVSATDSDKNQTLTYTLGGTDAELFSINSTNGQLQTNAPLDFETKSSYSVTITVSDGHSGSDSISVTINVIDVNENPTNNPPVFTEGDSTTRSVYENTGSGLDIGDAVSATDLDEHDLTYSLSGTDASSFGIDSTSGQLRTEVSLDYEAKSSYSVTITVSDGNGGSDSISVTIIVIDVFEDPVNNPPVFTEGDSTTREVAEDTGTGIDIGDAVSAIDEDADTLTYSLGGTDASSFGIDSTSGQLRTEVSLDYDAKSSYSVTITVLDGNGGSDSISVTINIIDVEENLATRSDENSAPVFIDGNSTTRSIAENAAANTSIGTPVSATDVDKDQTLTYTLGGTDAESFSINSTNGQLQTKAPLDFETKSTYSVTITVSDGNDGSDSISVTIYVTEVNENPANNPPMFTEGESTTRSVVENTSSGLDIGDAVSATDLDEDDLTYLLSGTDASSFGIDSTSGQLRTNAPLDYETKPTYSVIITVSDGNGGNDSITVTINVTNVNEIRSNSAPVFTEGNSTTRSVDENTSTGVNIGDSVSATDLDDDALTYTLGGTDAASFSIETSSGQLKTSTALNYELKPSYSVTVTVSDGTDTDIISVTINVANINEAPTFSDGESTTRSIAENVAANINIGSAVSATDPEEEVLTYILGGTDAASFSIDSTTGQLKTKATLDYESKNTFSVNITVSDGTLSDTITVTINVTDLDEAPSNIAPEFTEGESTTREVDENTAADADIGDPITATDEDNNTLAFLLSGTDGASFAIDSTTGQLKTSAALDHETKDAYEVTVTVSDGSDTDTISVTINVTDVNEAPVIASDAEKTLSVAENTASNVNIGSTLSATDQDDGDTLTYTLGGTDAASFDIDSTSGQLKTKAALDYEGKKSYSVTITVSDGTLTDTIDITINVTDVDENRDPEFTDGASTTREVAENTGTGVDIGDAVSATDLDNDELTYTLGGTDMALFSINSTTGQLRTKAALNHEEKSSYSVIITVSDGNNGTDSITVTINVTDVLESTPIGSRTQQVQDAILDAIDGVDDAADVTDTHLAAMTALDLSDVSITALTANDFDGFTALKNINLDGNSLSNLPAAVFSGLTTLTSLTISNNSLTNLPADVFDGLTSLTTLLLSGNSTDPLLLTVSLEKVAEGQFKAKVHTGAPFEIALPVSVTHGSISGSATTITIPKGSVESTTTLTVTRTAGTKAAVTVDIGTPLPTRPNSHSGYQLVKASTGLPLEVIPAVNALPEFTEGASTTREVVENTAAGWDIGDPVAATDDDSSDTLTYTLSGADAASFSIVSTTGQLQSKAALDYESKPTYTVSITVSDEKGGTDTITVTINVKDLSGNENTAPEFTDGDTTTREVAENTGTGTNIGDPVGATDINNDTLTYTLGGTDADSFGIVSTSGQLQTKDALDYEGKKVYTVIITVSDDNDGEDTITVTINVTDLDDNRPPVFTDGASTTREVAEDTGTGVDIGDAVSATDLDNDELTYRLSGTDAASFSINSTTGQIRTKAPLDYEGKKSYSVTITVSDGNEGEDTISVTINVTDVDENNVPEFTDGASTTREVAENTGTGVDIGDAVSATDLDNDELTYTLGGTDMASFSINSTTGQLRTKAALDYETKKSYSVSITVSDGKSGTDSITITINVTDVFESTPIGDRTQQVQDAILDAIEGVNDAADVTDAHLAAMTTLDLSDVSITALTANDFDGFTALTNINLDGNSLSNLPAAVFSGLTTLTSLTISNNSLTNLPADVFDGLTSLATLLLSGNSTDPLLLTVSLEKVAEGQFKAKVHTGAPFEMAIPVSATNGSISGDATTITIPKGSVESTTTLTVTRTAGTKAAVTVDIGTPLPTRPNSHSGYQLVKASTGLPLEVIPAVNALPEFTEGASTTREVVENTAAGWDIGDPVAATDDDSSDTLTYTLSGADAASFSIVSTTGQLQSKAALDYESKPTYTVSITVSDEKGGTDTITVTINVKDLSGNENTAPEFTDGDTTTREVAENTGTGTNIGDPVGATDINNDTLTYTLGGTDADSFGIVSTSGQLQTKDALDYEGKKVYTVIITVSDDNDGEDTITVTINVTDLDDNRPPVFTDGASTTREVAEDTGTGVDIGDAVSATDLDNDELTYRLSGTDAASFSINSTTGQIRTKAPLDYEGKKSYSVTITVSDGNEGEDTISVTINVTDVDENNVPEFTDGASTTREVAENTGTGVDIGDAVSATDLDNDELTYTLGGTDMASFSINSTTGQLRTKAALDYETKKSYSVSITVSDGKSGTDSITITINVTDVFESTPIGDRTQQVQDAILDAIEGVNDAADVTDAHLAAMTELDLSDKSITSLTANDFDGFTALTNINLADNSLASLPAAVFSGLTTLTSLTISNNSLTSLPAAVFDGLTSLTTLLLSGNSTDPLLLTVSLEKVAEGQFKAKVHTGAPFAMAIPVSATNGSISGGATAITIPKGSVESTTTLTVTRTSGTTAAVTVDMGTPLPTRPSSHSGYQLAKAITGLPLEVIPADNALPVFTEGESTTREVDENTAANTNIGTPVNATDTDTNDTLTYTLGGTDRASFSIVSTTGQLQTKAALDYESKKSYSVSITVSDGNSGTDSITVTINVTDVFESTPIGSRTQQVQDAILAAIDGVADAADVTDAHLAEMTALDLTEASITSLTANDFDGFTALTNIDLDGNSLASLPADVFSGLTTLTRLTFGKNSLANIPADVFSGLTNLTRLSLEDNLLTSLPDEVFVGLTSLTHLHLDNNSTNPLLLTVSLEKVAEGQFKAKVHTGAPFAMAIPVSATNGSISGGATTITIPQGSVESTTTLTVTRTAGTRAAVTVDIGTPLPSRPSAHSGYQLAKASTGLPLEVIASDNALPEFTEGASTTREVAENTGTGVDIGDAVSATDLDNDELTYTLGDTDRASFSINSTTGQLRTKAELDYESKKSYSVTITVSDGNSGTDSITITINVTDVFESTPIASRTQQVQDAILDAIEGVEDAADVTDAHLAEMTALDLSDKSITGLTANDFDGFTALTNINLDGNSLASLPAAVFSGLTTLTNLTISNNSLTNLPAAVFDGLTSLTTLLLSGNSTDPLLLTVSLEKVAEGQFKAKVHTGAPFEMAIPVSATNGSISGGATTITIPKGSVESTTTLTVTRTAGTTAAVTVDIGTPLPTRPTSHSGYQLAKASTGLPLEVIPADNALPEFTEGASTTREVAENTAASTNIGTPISATDDDSGDTLTYTLGGTDHASFSFVSTTGQLRTKAELDYESKKSYSVTITVSDGNSGTDSITVTINVTDVFESTPIGSRTQQVQDAILDAIEGVEDAADVTDAHLAAMTALDLSDKSITGLTANDFDGFTALTNIDLDGNSLSSLPAAVFSGLTTLTSLTISNNSLTSLPAAVFDGLTSLTTLLLSGNSTDPLLLTVSLEKVAEGQFKAKVHTGAPFAMAIPVSATNGSISGNATTITIPKGSVESTTTLTVTRTTGTTAAVTVDIGTPLPTRPSSHSGYQLAKASTGLPLEVIASDNALPVFTEGESTTREVVENTAANTNIGTPVSATDDDKGDTLTYTLSGTDADSFSIVSTTGQLQTKAELIYDEKTSYTVIITVSDGNNGEDTITVTINVTEEIATITPVNERTLPIAKALMFAVGVTTLEAVTEELLARITTLDVDQLPENETPLTTMKEGDFDGLTALTKLDLEENFFTDITPIEDLTTLQELILLNNNVSDLTPLRNMTSLTNLHLKNNNVSDISPLENLTAMKDLNLDLNSVSDISPLENMTSMINLYMHSNAISDISPLENMTGLKKLYMRNNNISDISPLENMTALQILSMSNNLVRDVSAVENMTALKTLTVGGNPISDYGPLRTLKENNPTVSIDIDIDNNPPVFADGDSTTRSIAENTPANTNIGTPVNATDDDGDTLTYTLGGTDADSFSIVSTSGQLQTKAVLNHEGKGSYTVTVSVSDGNDGLDLITVTINVTNVAETENNNPTFTEGESTTREVAENTAANTNIGTPVSATDADGDSLTYTLGGTDAASFSIVSTTGQLQTKAALDYDEKTSYSIIITVAESNGGTDTINVTINVTEVVENTMVSVNNAPTFTEGDSATRSIEEHTPANTNIGTPVNATDADTDDTLTYTLSGTDVDSFGIVSTTGQLQTKAALNYDTKTTYTVTITVSDGNTGTDTITVTINVTDATEVPVSDRTQAIREAIVAAISDVNSADDVTYEHLATITRLNLISESITSLQAGDFHGLTALTWLNLANNRISDISALGGLTALTTLDLSNNNNISDISALEGLTALTTLNLRKNSLSDISALDGLTALTNLTVSENSLSDISALDGLTALTSLDLRKNSISDISALDGLTALTSLNLRENSLSDISDLDGLTALTNLDLLKNSISDISALEDLTALTTLDLGQNSIVDISALEDLTQLTTLYLYLNRIVDISALENLTQLTKLNVFGNSITDISALSEFTSLTSLTLSENPLSDYTQIFPIVINNPDIEINLFLTNRSPVFTAGEDTTVEVAENTATNTNFGQAIGARDSDAPPNGQPPLTYYIRGTDADSFGVRIYTGTLYTVAALDFDTKSTYEVILFVLDDLGAYDKIDVTINVTQVASSPPSAQPSPDITALLSNYPNPFNPETWIPYQLAKPSDVSITIYDIRGNVVRHLDLGHQKTGFYTSRRHAAHWDGKNQLGEKVAAGVYFYQLQAVTTSPLRKMVILK